MAQHVEKGANLRGQDELADQWSLVCSQLCESLRPRVDLPASSGNVPPFLAAVWFDPGCRAATCSRPWLEREMSLWGRQRPSWGAAGDRYLAQQRNIRLREPPGTELSRWACPHCNGTNFSSRYLIVRRAARIWARRFHVKAILSRKVEKLTGTSTCKS